ncbi:MAG: hypothetical protein IOC71_07785 [Rhodobacter sp.]|nr:hypothetical protein [Rhodobacter sp.]
MRGADRVSGKSAATWAAAWKTGGFAACAQPAVWLGPSPQGALRVPPARRGPKPRTVPDTAGAGHL